MRLYRILAIAGPMLAATTVAAAPRHDIVVSQPVVRASIGPSANSAAYLTIANTGSRPQRLVSVRCACAASVEAHTSSMSGGVMRMGPAGRLTIPPHGTVSFRPDGLHLMVIGLKAPLKDGGRQVFTLVFDPAGPIEVAFPIRARIGAGGMGGMDMSH
jgi:hypothetical protein